ncbi:MAG: glycosyltransferase family 4 protein, partial [Candidatus Sumerlaeota bacterium]
MDQAGNISLIERMIPLFSLMLVGSLVLTPLVMRLAHKIGATDAGGYRRIHKRPVPLLGGLGVAAPFLLFSLALSLIGYFTTYHWQWVAETFPRYFSELYEIGQWRDEMLVLVLGSCGILALGLRDDIRGMSARTKLAGQAVVAVVVCCLIETPVGINIPLIGQLDFGEIGGRFLAVIWFLALINAFNLIDGMDGLATGVGAISALTFAALAVMTDNPQVLVMGVAFAGALCGFLLFNFHPAKIFLGDTGSMFIGFVFAYMTLTGSYRSEGAVVVLAPLIAVSFPLFETGISIVRRYMQGLPVFAGDSRHTHHRLLARGYSQRETVLILYAIVGSLSCAAVADRIVQPGSAVWWVPAVMYVGIFLFILWFADYIDPWIIGSVFKRRRRNKQLENFSRYGAISLSRQKRDEHRQAFFELCRYEMRLRYLAAWFENGEMLIASSGRPCEKSNDPDFDPVDRFRVNSLSHQPIVVRYQYEEH